MSKIPLIADDIRIIDEGGIFLEIEVTSGNVTVRAALGPDQLATLAKAFTNYDARLQHASKQLQREGPISKTYAKHLLKRTPRDVRKRALRKVGA